MAGSDTTNHPVTDTLPAAHTAIPVRSWSHRVCRMLLLYAVIPYVTVTMLFALFQRRLLYRPTHRNHLPAADIAGQTVVEDVELQAAEGLTLRGWHFRTETPHTESSPQLILYFPGNSGCRQDRVYDCREFTRLGFDVLLFDYRGYGDNSGSPSEESLAADARRAWTFATRQMNVSPDQIILFGESLGGAVAVRLAAEVTLADEPPRGLILNSTFASLPETVAWHYPAFPFQVLLWDRYPSADRIPHVTCPIVQFHGTADEFVPVEHGRQLFAAAPARSSEGVPKLFVTIEDGDHNSIPATQLREALARFADGAVSDAGE